MVRKKNRIYKIELRSPVPTKWSCEKSTKETTRIKAMEINYRISCRCKNIRREIGIINNITEKIEIKRFKCYGYKYKIDKSKTDIRWPKRILEWTPDNKKKDTPKSI